VIVVAGVLAAVAAVPLTGGNLAGLATLRLRWWWLAAVALSAQVLLITFLPDSVPWGAAVAVHLATYVLALGFVAANRRVPGLRLIALGGALNLTAIAANGGVMPASAAALEMAGQPATVNGFSNSAVVEHPHLLALGDVFGVPGPSPLGNVFSAGDVLLVLGGALLVHLVCRDQAPEPVTDAQPSSSTGRNRSGRVTHTA